MIGMKEMYSCSSKGGQILNIFLLVNWIP